MIVIDVTGIFTPLLPWSLISRSEALVIRSLQVELIVPICIDIHHPTSCTGHRNCIIVYYAHWRGGGVSGSGYEVTGDRVKLWLHREVFTRSMLIKE